MNLLNFTYDYVPMFVNFCDTNLQLFRETEKFLNLVNEKENEEVIPL